MNVTTVPQQKFSLQTDRLNNLINDSVILLRKHFIQLHDEFLNGLNYEMTFKEGTFYFEDSYLDKEMNLFNFYAYNMCSEFLENVFKKEFNYPISVIKIRVGEDEKNGRIGISYRIKLIYSDLEITNTNGTLDRYVLLSIDALRKNPKYSSTFSILPFSTLDIVKIIEETSKNFKDFKDFVERDRIEIKKSFVLTVFNDLVQNRNSKGFVSDGYIHLDHEETMKKIFSIFYNVVDVSII